MKIKLLLLTFFMLAFGANAQDLTKPERLEIEITKVYNGLGRYNRIIPGDPYGYGFSRMKSNGSHEVSLECLEDNKARFIVDEIEISIPSGDSDSCDKVFRELLRNSSKEKPMTLVFEVNDIDGHSEMNFKEMYRSH